MFGKTNSRTDVLSKARSSLSMDGRAIGKEDSALTETNSNDCMTL